MSDPRDFTDEMRQATIDGLPKLFVDGVTLFNEGDFFECHELLEELWRHADGDDAKFFQGLIQAAVSLYHFGNGNFDGAMRLARQALDKLDGLPAEVHRLRLGSFLTAYRPIVEPLFGPRERLKPLPYERCPRLEWTEPPRR